MQKIFTITYRFVIKHNLYMVKPFIDSLYDAHRARVYKKADKMRDAFVASGYVVKNTKEGTILKRRLTADL